MKTRDKILKTLYPETIAWVGGKTSFDLSKELGLHISTVRKHLHKLEKTGFIMPCAVPKFWREDGKTANTLVWFLRFDEK